MGVVITFLFVTLAWIPFRATSLSAAITLWASMFGGNRVLSAENPVTGRLPLAILMIAGFLALALFAPNTQQLLSEFH